MLTSRWVQVFSWAVVLGCSALGLARQVPPRSRPETSGLADFSAERAIEHVSEISRAPHPTGSLENERVRSFVAGQLRALGLEVVQLDAPGCTRLGPIQNCANTRNLIGILRGTRPSGPALLFSAHYDSVPSSPGAADDGAGVAALLEAARALQHSARLAHDVLFAFVDGEELLLLGASALVRTAEFQRVFLAVNFEARGNSGPSVLIDTTPGNSALVQHLASALSKPALNSLYVALASALPNGTDAELYRHKGPKVLSFAIADGLPFYHHGTDTPEHLSRGSLQHHGQHIVDIARHFGTIEPSSLESTEDSVFFDLFGLGVVRYSVAVARLLFFGLTAVFLWVLGRPALSSLKSGGGLLLGAGAWMLSVLLVTLFTGVWTWLGTRGLSANLTYAARAPVLLSGGLFSFALLEILRQHFGTRPVASVWAWQRLKLASYALWLLLSAALVIFTPTASHLLVWPLFGALIAQKLEDAGLTSLRPLGFIPTAILLPTFVRASAITFGSGAAPILAACLGLTFTWLVPNSAAAQAPNEPAPRAARPHRALTALAACGALLALVVGRLYPAPPSGTSMSYVLTRPGHAFFATGDAERTAWHERFVPRAVEATFSSLVPSLSALRLAPAPALDLSAPKMRFVEDEWLGNSRRIVLELKSPRRATTFLIEERTGAPLTSVHLKGASVDALARVSNEVDAEFLRRFAGLDARGNTLVTLHGIPRDGTRLEVETASEAELRFRLSDESTGLPERLWDLATRPPTLTTGYPGDTTRVVAPAVVVAAKPRPSQ